MTLLEWRSGIVCESMKEAAPRPETTEPVRWLRGGESHEDLLFIAANKTLVGKCSTIQYLIKNKERDINKENYL